MRIKEGQRVQEKYTNIKGTIVLIQRGHFLVEWDNGFKDIVHISYCKHINIIQEGE